MENQDENEGGFDLLKKCEGLIYERYERTRGKEEFSDGESVVGTVMLVGFPSVQTRKAAHSAWQAKAVLASLLHFYQFRTELIVRSRGCFPDVQRDVTAFWTRAGHTHIALKCGKLLVDEGARHCRREMGIGPRMVAVTGTLSFRQTDRGIELTGPALTDARTIFKAKIQWRTQLLARANLVRTADDRTGMRDAGRVTLDNGMTVGVMEYRPKDQAPYAPDP